MKLSKRDFLANELINLCKEDLSQREVDGPNRSKMIDAINTRLGVPLGSPYCIGGLLVRGVARLCDEYKLNLPVNFPFTAGTQKFWYGSLKQQNGFVHSYLENQPYEKAKKGSIGILQNKVDKAHGHAFMFAEDESDVQHTIEYNTNLKGSRNGDGVYELARTVKGTSTKIYLGNVDVVSWILIANPQFEIPLDV